MTTVTVEFTQQGGTLNTMTNPLTEAQDLLRSRMQTLCDTLAAKAPVHHDPHADVPIPVSEYTFTIYPAKSGQRYVRIVMQYRGHNDAVHAFVDTTNGDLLKAATWKAPAKQARGNLLDDADFDRILAACDWAGGYLYLR